VTATTPSKYRQLRRTYLSTKVGFLPANDVRRANRREDETGCSITLAPEEENGLSVMAVFRLQERCDEELCVSFELVDPANEVLAFADYQVIPDADLYAIAMRIKADIRVITNDEVWGPTYEMYETLHLRWRVRVFDSAGRRIGRNVVGHEICGD
jgi:hypothetical protein